MVAIFVDFRKAFDCVDHTLLVEKLQRANLGPNVVGWMENYLERQKQQVLANGFKSDLANITQGVPQGSILGPTFYTIYANNIPQYVSENKIALYADDTVIYSKAKNVNDIKGVCRLILTPCRNGAPSTN